MFLKDGFGGCDVFQVWIIKCHWNGVSELEGIRAVILSLITL